MSEQPEVTINDIATSIVEAKASTDAAIELKASSEDVTAVSTEVKAVEVALDSKASAEEVVALKEKLTSLEAKMEVSNGDAQMDNTEVKNEIYTAIAEVLSAKGQTQKSVEIKATALGQNVSGADKGAPEDVAVLWRKLEEGNPLRALANKVTISTPTYMRPVLSGKLGASYGNIASTDPSNFNVSEKQLTVDKLSGWTVVGEDWNSDVVGGEAIILDKIGDDMANVEAQAMITGTGSNQPTGLDVVSTAATAVQSSETILGLTGSTSGAVVYADIVKVIYSLAPMYRANASFMIATDSLEAIRSLVDSNGLPLWQPSVIEGEPGRLLGYPVYENTYMTAKATGKPILYFADWNRFYQIVDREGITISNHEAQAALGTNTIFARMRNTAGILDVFSGVRLNYKA